MRIWISVIYMHISLSLSCSGKPKDVGSDVDSVPQCYLAPKRQSRRVCVRRMDERRLVAEVAELVCCLPAESRVASKVIHVVVSFWRKTTKPPNVLPACRHRCCFIIWCTSSFLLSVSPSLRTKTSPPNSLLLVLMRLSLNLRVENLLCRWAYLLYQQLLILISMQCMSISDFLLNGQHK